VDPSQWPAPPTTPPPINYQPGQDFGPGNDLIGTLIDPQVDPRLGLRQGQVDQAVMGLSGGPDRTNLARQQFEDFLSQGGTEFDRRVREITQRAAAGGRTGSGMYGSDLVDTTTAFNRDAQYEANRLASNLANATRDDQFRMVDTLAGLEGQSYNQGFNDRNELRGERGYQYGLSQDALKNAERQRLVEEELLNSSFGRDEKRIDDLIRLGYMNNPAGAYGAAGATGNAQADAYSQQIRDLLNQYLTQQTAGG